MKIFTLAITILLFFFLFQTVFSQNTEKSKDPKQIMICSDCFTIRKQTFSPKIEYPKAAKAVRASGAVKVSVTIDENGNVVEAKAISGHLLLQSTAVKAALQSKFEVYKIGGNPVKGYGVIVYNFDLDKPVQKNQPKIQPTSTLIGKAIKLFKPPFPSNCRCKFSKNKRIVIQFTVDERGNVEAAMAVSGHPLLKQASEAAIRASKFSVSLFENTPVKAFGIIVYDFVVMKKGWQSRVIKYELKLK